MRALDLVPELGDVATEALQAPYSSFSSTDQSETGIGYQAVAIGDVTTRGHRKERGHVLDLLDLQDKRVLDLGSNVGEMSRHARARGARRVDGFEYDPYFIEVANLLNVIADTTRVSFFQRDISDPEVYAERYDVVMAFSVMRFMVGCLDQIAQITDVLLVEAHTLGGNFDRRLRRLAQRFPAYRMLGESDIRPEIPHDLRPVILFARDEEHLIAALAPHLRDGGRAAGALALGSPAASNLRGSIDALTLEGEDVHLEGWCLDQHAPHDTLDLIEFGHSEADPRSERSLVAVSEPCERPDVEAALPALAHARRSGFAFDHRTVAAAGDRIRFEVIAYRGLEAVGTISAWYLDGMYDSMPAPPPPLAERHWGTGEPRRLALASLGTASAMLEAVDRYRRLDSFESLLDWGCGIGLLERYVSGIAPGAALTAVDWDREALAWARAAGLPARSRRSRGPRRRVFPRKGSTWCSGIEPWTASRRSATRPGGRNCTGSRRRAGGLP
jgi:SAM-dependent methyltransferase